MAKILAMTCPSCGGKLQLPDDTERFTCGFCGNEHMLRRSGSVFTIEPLVMEVRKMGQTANRVAVELKIHRLERELEQMRAEALIDLRNDDALYDGMGDWLGGILRLFDRKRLKELREYHRRRIHGKIDEIDSLKRSL